jgi:hypothetical protein
MDEFEKKKSFMGLIIEVIGSIGQIVTTSLVSPIIKSADGVMKNIEDRIMHLQQRLLKRIYIAAFMGGGAVLLAIATLFFMIEELRWSNALSFFSIGSIIFLIGLLLKFRESDK